MRLAIFALALCGCGDNRALPADARATDAPPDAPVAPVFRNPVAMADAELALAALQTLGADVDGAVEPGCRECHSLTRQQLRNWRVLSDTALASCLTDLAVTSQQSARTMIDCSRAMPEVASSDFIANKLGIYATAAHLPWFQFTVRRAYDEPAGPSAADELVTTAGMPRSGGSATPLTQAQFDVVAEWFVRGLPRLDETLPQDPPPDRCEDAVSVDVAAHVAAMKTAGWRAINASNQLAMFACGAATDPRQCLAAIPLAADQPYGAGWDLPGRGRLRVLADVGYRSQYWTRSSPDGRFVAHGVLNVPGSYVLDLQRGALPVPIAAIYDPNWFPDGSGFVFQGGARNTCAESVLTANPSSIAMTEPGCAQIGSIGLYEHAGRLLGGGDHFAIASQFVSDDGGHVATHTDPEASFSARAGIDFVPLIFDGTRFMARPKITIPTAFEGDTALSPSAKLVMSRVAGPGDRQVGYVLRKVIATPAGATYIIQAPEIARYCVAGGKVGFSYDEHWVAYHHYVAATDADAIELGFTGAADPAFAPYVAQGAANLYLMELATGARLRITNMRPGQYALFPHFRSDGWIHAAVRDVGAGREYMVASDAALLAEQP